MTEEFNPWAKEATLEDIASDARRWQTVGREDLGSSGSRVVFVEWLLEVLQARAALDAAALQAKTATDLVKATWVLVGVTFVLAIAAFIALLIA